VFSLTKLHLHVQINFLKETGEKKENIIRCARRHSKQEFPKYVRSGTAWANLLEAESGDCWSWTCSTRDCPTWTVGGDWKE